MPLLSYLATTSKQPFALNLCLPVKVNEAAVVCFIQMNKENSFQEWSEISLVNFLLSGL